MANPVKLKHKSAKLRPWRINDVVDGWRLRVQLSTAAQTYRGDDTALRAAALNILKSALFRGRMIAQERLENGGGGLDCAELLAAVQDVVISALYDFTLQHIFRVHNRTNAERLTICATGGYGRNALAPSSDIDLMFIRAVKESAWAESVIEYVLYMLWDMGLKVGHASRTIPECLRAAKEDFTIRTSVLETRYICGDEDLLKELNTRLRNELFNNSIPEFVAAKMKERDNRHRKMGESRYMVEPNIKDGKGGLRDMHTMFWIAKYIHNIDVDTPKDYVDRGIFTKEQMETFMDAAEFLWTVRCHLHFLTGRPEEKLTFDLQPEMARRMGYGDRADNPAVERFMKHYFVVSKQIGSLTRIMSAKLEADALKQAPPGLGAFFSNKQKPLSDKRFVLSNGRIGYKDAKTVVNQPISMFDLFLEANRRGLDIEPRSLAHIAEVAPKSIGLSRQKEAKHKFLEIMAVENGPFHILNFMNETGLLGRMVPEFGRIVGQTQFNMYHHFTVDEHTLRAVEIIGQIEQGKLAEEVPIASAVFPKIHNRLALYLAMLLHDVGKGEGDQQILGAKATRVACKRLGVSEEETELAAWIVGHHLLMSDVAQKRDLSDPETIAKFAAEVENLERLRLLLVLTVADIRAVGPGIWNDWKAQLLRDLYNLTEAVLRGGKTDERFVREVLYAQVAGKRNKLLEGKDVAQFFTEIEDAYWLGFDESQIEWHIVEAANYLKSGQDYWIANRIDNLRNVTEIMVIAGDRRGLIYDMVATFARNSASVVDARVFTSSRGVAFDVFTLHDANYEAFGKARQNMLFKLENELAAAIHGDDHAVSEFGFKPSRRHQVFQVEPFVLFDNQGSTNDTIIEVSGSDRPGLLAELTKALLDEALNITSAHITSTGERAQDAFYVRKLDGTKLLEPHRIERLKKVLEEILQNELEAPTIATRRKLAQARSSTRR